jgi:hypothetical protein
MLDTFFIYTIISYNTSSGAPTAVLLPPAYHAVSGVPTFILNFHDEWLLS